MPKFREEVPCNPVVCQRGKAGRRITRAVMCSFMVTQLCYLPNGYLKEEINSGERQLKPAMAV